MVPNMKIFTVNRKIHIGIPVVGIDIIVNMNKYLEQYRRTVLFLHHDFPVFSLISKDRSHTDWKDFAIRYLLSKGHRI